MQVPLMLISSLRLFEIEKSLLSLLIKLTCPCWIKSSHFY